MINHVFIHTYVNICKPYVMCLDILKSFKTIPKYPFWANTLPQDHVPAAINGTNARSTRPFSSVDVERPGHWPVLAGPNKYESPPENPLNPMVVLNKMYIELHR